MENSEMKHGGLRWRKRLTDVHISFIQENHKTMTMPEMAKALNVPYDDVMRYVLSNKLEYKKAGFKKLNEVPENVKSFILANHKKISIPRIAEALKVKDYIVRMYMERNGLERVGYGKNIVAGSTVNSNLFDVNNYAREVSTI